MFLAILVILTATVHGKSIPIGSELAAVVRDVLSPASPTIDVCVLFDSPHVNWTDTVTDFCRQLEEDSRFVLILVEDLGLTMRQCGFYLIFMDDSRFFPRCILNELLFGIDRRGSYMTRPERFTLFLLTVLLFVLSESYTAMMLEFMVSSKYEPHITTMDQFMATNQSIYTNSYSASKHLTSNFPQYASNIHVLKNSSYDYSTKVRYAPCISLQTLLTSSLNSATNANFTPMYAMDQPVVTMLMGHTLSRVQPFAQKFKQVYDRLQEAGLPDYWLRRVSSSIPAREPPEQVVLEFADLISLWFILMYGWCLASAVLCLELVNLKRDYLIIQVKLAWRKGKVIMGDVVVQVVGTRNN